MRNFDFAPYRRTTVGFDRLFDFLENATRTDQVENYPPFDIEKVSDDAYRITLAVAGFRQKKFRNGFFGLQEVRRGSFSSRTAASSAMLNGFLRTAHSPPTAESICSLSA